MTGVLKARTAIGPDVWEAVGGSGVSQEYVDQRTTKRWSATGIALTGAAVTADTTVVTVNVPAQPIAGVLFAVLLLRFDKTVASDAHIVTVRDGGVSASSWYSGAGNTSVTAVISCCISALTSTAKTITGTIMRNVGTGTINTYAAYGNTHLDVLWFPG